MRLSAHRNYRTMAVAATQRVRSVRVRQARITVQLRVRAASGPNFGSKEMREFWDYALATKSYMKSPFWVPKTVPVLVTCFGHPSRQ